MSLFLAGDVGGTKTILRLVRSAHEILHEASYPSQEFPDLVPIVRRFLAAAPSSAVPDAACFAIAGPVAANASELTNLAWSLSGARLEHDLGIPHVRLINDFAAVGHGVVGLGTEALRTLQPGTPDPAAPIAVIGAGTGLGQGFLIPTSGGHQAFASEGGHADFAPRSTLEFQLLAYLQEAHRLTRVSVERVVSGLGIAAIYEFLRDRELARESPAMTELFRSWKQELGRKGKTVDLAAEISRAARAGSDELCRETMRLFLEAYGAEAGNLALKLLPYGGLYVAGGIAAKNLPLLEEGRFLDTFLAKGRMRPLLERVPVHVVLDAKVGLVGAALVASGQAAAGSHRD